MMFSDKIKKVNNFLINNLIIVLLIFLILFIFIGLKSANCVSKDYDVSRESSYVMADSAPAPMMAKARVASTSSGVRANGVMAGNGDDSKKIVKTYTLSVEVKDVDNANEKLNSIVEGLKGYVDNFYSYNYGNGLAYSYNIRIPSVELDGAVDSFKKLGTLKSESSSVQDMTEQYADNDSRLQNLKARRDRLRKMMDTKTDKLADVLAVDKELSDVQYQIENFEKRNKVIDKDVSYSQVSVTIIPEPKVDEFSGSKWKLSTSWNSAVNKLFSFLRGTVDYGFMTVVFLPLFVLIFITLYAIKRIVFKKIKK